MMPHHLEVYTGTITPPPPKPSPRVFAEQTEESLQPEISTCIDGICLQSSVDA